MFWKVFSAPILIIYYGIGLWGFILTLQYIYHGFGGIAAFVSVFLLPVAFVFAPIYAVVADGYWTPLVVSYTPLLLLTLIQFGPAVIAAILSSVKKSATTIFSVILASLLFIAMSLLLIFIGGGLGYGIAKTTHLNWPFFIILAGMLASAAYSSFYLSFRVFKTANRKVSFFLFVAISIFGRFFNGLEWHSGIDVAISVFSFAASAIGGWIAVAADRPRNPEEVTPS